MRGCSGVAIAATACLLGLAASSPVAMHFTPARPGDAADIIITKENTLNATAPAPTDDTITALKVHEKVVTQSNQLPLSFVNHFAGSIYAYVTGLDSSGSLVFLNASGSFYYPTADSSYTTPREITADISIPVGGKGSTLNITLPDYMSSGRIYFANNELHFYTIWSGSTNNPGLVQPSSTNPSDPNSGINWGFVELTNTAAELYADLTYLDFVGMPLGLKLTTADGKTQSAAGVKPSAVSTICTALTKRSSVDGQPWGDLCQTYNGAIIRVIGPQDYISLNPSAFEDYWTNYVNRVWTHFQTHTLTINTQAAAGDVACKVSGDTMTCAGDNRGYAKPSANDIFGCNSGPFAIQSGDNAVHYAVVPRLCAAFDRSSFLIGGGDTQPNGPAVSTYYEVSPTNWFSKLVHRQEIDGLGYAFAYDDVAPTGSAGVSGNVVAGNGASELLQVIIGGPS